MTARSGSLALLAVAVLLCAATGAQASQPPAGYPQQPLRNPGAPQGYPSDSQQERKAGSPGQQSPAPWQSQQLPPQQQQQGLPPQQQQPPPQQQRGPPAPYGQPPRSGPPAGYRGPGGPPPQQQQQRPGGYSQGYPPAQQYGRPSYPPQQQQQPQQDGPGFFSRMISKVKGDGGAGNSQYGGYQQQQQQQQPYGYGRPPPPQQQQHHNTWAGSMTGGDPHQRQAPGPGALTPAGPVRGPMGGPPPQQRPSPPQHQQQQQQPYGQQQSQYNQQQQQPHDGEGASWTGGFRSLIGKVFTGDGAQDGSIGAGGVPSFRPKGSTLSKKQPTASPDMGYGMPGQYPGAYPGYPGGPMGLIPGASGGAGEELQGPGKPQVVTVDASTVFVLKPKELEKKKRKFKADGLNKLQVVTSFDSTLTSFTTKDGNSNSQRTAEILEHNQQLLLPEAAKKIRYLRSEFKRRMEAEGKAMAPADRAKELEQHLRKVYSVAAMEGGIHMSGIGPAIETQMDSIPLREGASDMIAALAYRGIPLTVVCTGYANVALEVLKRAAPSVYGPSGGPSPHVQVIGNYFMPDETNTIYGMVDTVPLVHEGNKNGKMIMDFVRAAHWDVNMISSRPNVMLLGADLGDLNLANGLPNVEDRITVGFLKIDEDFLEKFPRYAQAFDVVVLGNGDLAYANEVLHEIANS